MRPNPAARSVHLFPVEVETFLYMTRVAKALGRPVGDPAQQLFLISDVARQLNVPPHRVAYLYMTRKLPESALKLGNRRIFTLADVQRVAKALRRPVGEQEAK
jgi:hypothetical protein